MTKAELLQEIADVPDDAWVYVLYADDRRPSVFRSVKLIIQGVLVHEPDHDGGKQQIGVRVHANNREVKEQEWEAEQRQWDRAWERPIIRCHVANKEMVSLPDADHAARLKLPLKLDVTRALSYAEISKATGTESPLETLARHEKALDDFKAGHITADECRAVLGLSPLVAAMADVPAIVEDKQ